MKEALVAVVDEVARALPRSSVDALAKALDREPAPSPEARQRAASAVPVSAFSYEARRLVDAWMQSGDGIPGSAVALALLSSQRTQESMESIQSIDIVWTGPTTKHVPVRLMRAVLLEVIRSATRRLTIVSFAAYKVDEVLHELEEAIGRGVEVRLILESTEESSGFLTKDAATAFEGLGSRARFYTWPAERRPAVAYGTAALHAKAAIADQHTALVTSANLTGHGINQNLELGLLVRGGSVPSRLDAHFAELILSETLQPSNHS